MVDSAQTEKWSKLLLISESPFTVSSYSVTFIASTRHFIAGASHRQLPQIQLTFQSQSNTRLQSRFNLCSHMIKYPFSTCSWVYIYPWVLFSDHQLQVQHLWKPLKHKRARSTTLTNHRSQMNQNVPPSSGNGRNSTILCEWQTFALTLTTETEPCDSLLNVV